eukprot:231267_1
MESLQSWEHWCSAYSSSNGSSNSERVGSRAHTWCSFSTNNCLWWAFIINFIVISISIVMIQNHILPDTEFDVRKPVPKIWDDLDFMCTRSMVMKAVLGNPLYNVSPTGTIITGIGGDAFLSVPCAKPKLSGRVQCQNKNGVYVVVITKKCIAPNRCQPISNANDLDAIVGPYNSYLYDYHTILTGKSFKTLRNRKRFTGFQHVIKCSNKNHAVKVTCQWTKGPVATYVVKDPDACKMDPKVINQDTWAIQKSAWIEQQGGRSYRDCNRTNYMEYFRDYRVFFNLAIQTGKNFNGIVVDKPKLTRALQSHRIEALKLSKECASLFPSMMEKAVSITGSCVMKCASAVLTGNTKPPQYLKSW